MWSRFRPAVRFAVVLAFWIGLPIFGQEPSIEPAGLDGRPLVVVADVDAIIHPISAEFMVSTIDRAEAAGADLVVFTLRTPGGLVDSTRTIISRIITSPAPVAVFVAPGGARAASAGFYILLAADVAAMAPGTHVGAAHPVAAGGSAEGGDETMAKKAASDLAAYARSLATQRGRNVELAEEAVFESRSFTEQEALGASPPLIDLVAADLDELLRELDGRTVSRWDGSSTELHVADARIEPVEMTMRQRILSAIAHPQVALLLFSLGTLGLTIELWNPGGILPGVVGGLCLLLAFFAFQILPVNYVGLLLMLFGLVLLVLEIMVTSFGILAVGGIISLIFGALMMMDSPVPELQVGLGFVGPLMIGVSLIVLFLVRLAVKAQLMISVTGPSGMIGEAGQVVQTIAPPATGLVMVHGERWRATASEPLPAGERVRVAAVDGLTLTVRRLESDSPEGERS